MWSSWSNSPQRSRPGNGLFALESAYRKTEEAGGRRFATFLDRVLARRLDPLKFLKGY